MAGRRTALRRGPVPERAVRGARGAAGVAGLPENPATGPWPRRSSSIRN